MTIPRRRSRSWAGRSCRPIRPRCIASSTRWACTTPCCSAARSSDAALATTVARSDVFVLTSRHEGFGVPVLEAMTLGVPVVANAAGALPEVVGDAGLLVDALDPYAVAEAVARLRSEAGLRETLAAVASRRVDALDLPRRGTRRDLVSAVSGRP